MNPQTEPTAVCPAPRPGRLLAQCCLLLFTAQAHAASLQDLQASTVRLDPRTPFFHLASTNIYGARGREQIDVSSSGECNAHRWVFDHAELLVGTVRYGGAFIRSAPTAGCATCDPLVVDWYHEPAGKLSFSINVFRREAFVPCATHAPESPQR